MLATSVCQLLDIDHPILNAPMGSAANAELAAAVSEAGGFGLIGTGSRHGPSWLRDQIQQARELTQRPFGVGFVSCLPGLDKLVDVALAEHVTAMSHSFADPTPYIPAAHAAGVKVFVQVQTVAQARRAVDAGADLLAAQGTGAGGHTGYSDALAIIPAVLDVAGDIPVVAAGAIADGRGLAAVLLLGAEGAWVGTRFLASHEAGCAQWMKQRVVEASSDDTVLTKAYDFAMAWAIPESIGDRVIRNAYTATWHNRDEDVKQRREELRAQIVAAAEEGNANLASVRASNACGLITRIEPVRDIVHRMVEEAATRLQHRASRLVPKPGEGATT